MIFMVVGGGGGQKILCARARTTRARNPKRALEVLGFQMLSCAI